MSEHKPNATGLHCSCGLPVYGSNEHVQRLVVDFADLQQQLDAAQARADAETRAADVWQQRLQESVERFNALGNQFLEERQLAEVAQARADELAKHCETRSPARGAENFWEKCENCAMLRENLFELLHLDPSPLTEKEKERGREIWAQLQTDDGSAQQGAD